MCVKREHKKQSCETAYKLLGASKVLWNQLSVDSAESASVNVQRVVNAERR